METLLLIKAAIAGVTVITDMVTAIGRAIDGSTLSDAEKAALRVELDAQKARRGALLSEWESLAP